MEEKIFVPVILGANREGRRSEKVSKFIIDEISKRDDIETRLFDVRDFKFPEDGYGQFIKDEFPEWRDAIARSDGLIVVSPEYNHGYPGPLKSVIDLLYDEYRNKALGIVGVSGGNWGGTRVIENLIPVLNTVGLVTAGVLQFPNMAQRVEENIELGTEAEIERVRKFLDSILWMARTLRYGRENIKI